MTLRKNLTLGAVVLGFATILVIEWAGVDIINLFKVLTDGSDSHTPLSQQVISTNSVVFEMDSLPLQPAEMSMSELAAPPVGKNLKTVSGRV